MLTNSNTSGKKKVCVIGSGSWGTALANLFAESGFRTQIWGRDAAVLKDIRSRHQNSKFLPGLKLNPNLIAATDIESALDEAEWVVCSIPTQAIRAVFTPHPQRLAGKCVINASKGMEIETRLRVSQIFQQISPSCGYLVLSGPSFAEEVVRRLPTLVTIAGDNETTAIELQKGLRTSYFRCYITSDVAGVECAGAMKNVIAIASGMVAGLGYGFNTQAAVINRGLAEITKLGVRIGGNPLTFLGLAGMGDLILTCTGSLSRNRRLGLLLGEGLSLDQASHQLGGVAEGYFTTKAAYLYARELEVDMPILNEIHGILYGDTSPKEAVESLMSRDTREEWDGIDQA